MVMSSPAASIQARTLFGSSSRQIPMPHDLRFRKENLQIPEKVNESRFLLSGHGVARLALLIKPSLIADADRASIIRSGMSPYLQQLAVLRHRTIFSDVEVIADALETTSFVACLQGLYGEVLRYFCGRTVDDDQIDFTHGFLMNYGVRREFLMIGSSVRKTRWRWR